MSLNKKPEVAPEKLAANRANGRLSCGPVTPEGLERARESRVIHGFYSDNQYEALRVPGEDPERVQQLVRLAVRNLAAL